MPTRCGSGLYNLACYYVRPVGRLQGVFMTTLELKVSLPEPLAREAQAAGLFSPEALERLTQVRDALVANPLPTMTPKEIQAEIDAYRAHPRSASGT
jgi:hypothetical protein